MKTTTQPAIAAQWKIITRPDGTLWIQGEPDAHGWREVCSLPFFPSRDREKVAANAQLLCAAPAMLGALRAAETALDFQLTNVNALANWMDEPTGLAIIYQIAEQLGEDLTAIRGAIATAEGRA